MWLAEELTFRQRLVAIKEPRADLPVDVREEVGQRYQREIMVCAELEKAGAPHIVRALTAEPVADGLLLVLTYMPNGDLAHLLSQHPHGLPLAQALAIAQTVLAALQGAHAHPLEIVHRDVKPSNILFDGQGQAYLGDFGLAQVANTSGSLTRLRGGSVGTPLYAAPEQEKGIGYVTPGADLYALGCVLFEMLTGKRYKRVKPGTRASSLRPETPAWLDEAVERALADEAWSRWEARRRWLPRWMQKRRKRRNVNGRAAPRQAELKRQPELARQRRERAAKRRRVEAAAGPRTPKGAERERQVREAEVARQAELKRQQEAVRRGPIEFDWVDIPAGPFLMGSDKKKDSDAGYGELPQHTVTLPMYRIGADAGDKCAVQGICGCDRLPSAKSLVGRADT
ncbi:MAG: protein kinase [Anaerolineae bacterium]|uniref:bifunctional serine/threonine-protein kinase/formylglycine-generating enzyme family protein n=1 Tax=Candidatus Amarolinea dominans TaxID=3140696 RepID=UPI0031353713|nr:protein kinase [Anaerolineae bacterium]